jgi:hypothetical protein
VLRLGIAPDYVLDKMQMYEVHTLLEYEYYKHKDSWEQSRFISYITAQVNSTKPIKPDSLMKFHWENEGRDTRDSDKSVSNEDVKRLSEMARKMQESMSKNNNIEVNNGDRL